jgi:acyl-coenzyme A synthetase/AMP-(fatty) acid ligase
VVSLRPGRFALADGLRSFCGEQLEKVKVPATIEFVERLPLTSTHRMHRGALSARRMAGSAGCG